MFALLIGIVGPALFCFLGYFGLNLWNKTVDKDPQPNILSRILGSSFSTLWTAAIVMMVLVFVAMIPVHWGWLKTAQNNIVQSLTYRTLNRLMPETLITKKTDIEQLANVLKTPRFPAIARTKEYQTLVNDPKVKDLLADEKIVDDIEQKNIPGLVSNPKIHTVLKDPALVEKFYQLHKKILALEKKPGSQLSSQK